jgi:hypothetical protein
MCLTSLRLAALAEAALTLSSSLAWASVIGCPPVRAAAAAARAAPPAMKARLDVSLPSPGRMLTRR